MAPSTVLHMYQHETHRAMNPNMSLPVWIATIVLRIAIQLSVTTPPTSTWQRRPFHGSLFPMNSSKAMPIVIRRPHILIPHRVRINLLAFRGLVIIWRSNDQNECAWVWQWALRACGPLSHGALI